MPRAATSTRVRIIDAARAEFEINGPSTRAIAIMARAKVSNGSFINAFPRGKVDVAVAVYLDVEKEIWAGVLGHFAVPLLAKPLVSIRGGHLHLNERISEDRGRARLLFQLEEELLQGPVGAAVENLIRQRWAVIGRWAASVTWPTHETSLLPAGWWSLIFGPAVYFYRAWAFGHLNELPADTHQWLARGTVCAYSEFGTQRPPSARKSAKVSTRERELLLPEID